jgi:autoinducer 2-degrading protein
MYSIFVTIDIKPEHVEEFKKDSLGDAEGSVRDEPGCFRFDIHQDVATSTRFYLYEVYRDEEAFQAHLQAPHFLVWQERVKTFFDGDPELVTMETVFPSEVGWGKQKPGLVDW